MRRLFDDNPDAVAQAYADSLDETWGDKLVATTLMGIGIYIDERYGHFFNGERPLITQVKADRICSPLVSFHGLAQAARMKEVGKKFRKVEKPVFWKDIWEIYGQPALDTLEKKPIGKGQDHVGRQDDPKMKAPADTAEICVGICESRKTCLAWTWDEKAKVCSISDWVIIGENPGDKTSGLNVQRVKKLVDECGK